MAGQRVIEPRIDVQQISRRQDVKGGAWHLQWQIKNLAQQPLTIFAVRLPHGQFRSREQEFALPYRLSGNESAALEIEVVCSEAPGTVVENAFLILRVLWLNNPWRIFARLRVTFDSEGAPHAGAELITTQQTGFSERL
ncbi:MAG: hypothetical protein ACREQW_13815 [Candidatus Binatia bacterium]